MILFAFIFIIGVWIGVMATCVFIVAKNEEED